LFRCVFSYLLCLYQFPEGGNDGIIFFLYSSVVFSHTFCLYQFLEGGKCEVEKNYSRGQVTCNVCPNSNDKYKIKTDDNISNRRSGDWKYDDDSFDRSLPGNVHDVTGPDWKWKNLYGISDLEQSNRWHHSTLVSGTNVSTNLLREPCSKIEDRYEDSVKCDPRSNYLHNFREYLVNYQESCGVPRTEYSFSALIRIMGQATGRSLLALLYVILNIIPVVEVFLYILRFILDKVISIRNSKNLRQTMIRCAVFTTELFSVYVCLIFIFGFIVLPIVQMVIGITAKIMLYS
ncbi:uncharacterized protein LOC143152567, partial [Ptiloglossa arizonensis]|uniref:uncharacterized protein LOC143152567 n=1 Tax=Ptiloglossa arizonensis TaxID=3350558 RepID=UPI003F9FB83A